MRATQNGDTLLWPTAPDPERWTIVVTDGGSWWHFDGCLADFLVGVLGGHISCPILPEFTPVQVPMRSSFRRLMKYASQRAPGATVMVKVTARGCLSSETRSETSGTPPETSATTSQEESVTGGTG